jgi:hypothetical protein
MSWRDQQRQATGEAIPGYKPAFTFTFHPWDLFVREDGEVLPILGMVIHEKGLGGCRATGPTTDDVDEDPALLNAGKSGRMVVPHDIRVRAFGEERVGYLGDKDQRPLKAAGGNYWLDAWTRITWLHGEPQYNVDADGYLDFHRRVLARFLPEGLDSAQIQRAETRSGRKAGPNGKPFPAKTAEPEPTRKVKGA